MPSLKQVVEETDTRAGVAFDVVIQLMIVTSLVSFAIGTIPDMSPAVDYWLGNIEIVTVAIFTAEYLLRIYVASHRWRFIFSFYGLVDLIAVLPFYIASGIDLRSIRVFRFLRLFRLLKLARYSRAIQRFQDAFAIAKEEIVLFFGAAFTVIYVAAVGIYYFENPVQPQAFKSVIHSLWWAVVTLTTVGYGDMYPVTVGGKIFTFFVLLAGLSIVSVPPGLIASALSEARRMENIRAEKEGRIVSGSKTHLLPTRPTDGRFLETESAPSERSSCADPDEFRSSVVPRGTPARREKTSP